MRVFVYGSFDVLHVGHVRILRHAASLGEVVVGLNDDESIALRKGKNRPFNKIGIRSEIVSALRDVAEVLTYTGDSPLELLQDMLRDRDLRPGIVVRGSQHARAKINGKTDPVHKLIKDRGISLEFFPMVPKSYTMRTYRQFVHAARLVDE